jgi:hypothetical protein
VVVTDGEVEIRYVLPTSPDGPHLPYCQLRKDHLDHPPRPGHPDQPNQRGDSRAPAGVAGQLAVAAAAHSSQRASSAEAGAASSTRAQSYSRRPLAPWPAPQATTARPAPRRPTGRRWPLLGGRPQRLGTLDGQRRGDAAVLQEAPQGRVAAVGLIGRHPRSRHPSLQGALQHDPGQLRLGLEPDLLRDPRGPAPGRIVGPTAGRYSSRSTNARPFGAGIGQKGAHLAVVDLAGGAEYWRCTPTEVVPFSRKPVSSATSTPPGSPRCSTTQARRSSRTRSRSQSAVANNRCIPSGCARRRARPAASRSCAPRCRAARAGMPAPAGVARRGRTAPRRGRAGRPPRRPRRHFFDDCRLVGLRHDPSRPPWPLDCQPIPAGGREPSLIPKCGWSTNQGEDFPPVTDHLRPGRRIGG